MLRRRPTFLALILLSLLISSTAQALNRKTDVLSFYNGDRITGEILKMYGGILELKTAAMGTIKIEWQDIAKLESKYNYEIRLSNGQRHYGTINTGVHPGEIDIADLYGDHTVAALEVVELRPIKERWLDRIDLYLSAQYNYNKASSVQSSTFNTDISYEDERTQTTFTGRLTNTKTNTEDSRSVRADLSRRIWTNRQEVYRLAFGNYENNDEQGLDRRIALGGGLGRYFIDTNRNRLTGAFGVQALTERKIDSSSDDQSVELFLSGEYAMWRFDTPEMDISLNGSVYPSLTENDRWRADSDIRIRWELLEDLFWDVSAWGTYDSDAESEKEFDYGISTGIGWQY